MKGILSRGPGVCCTFEVVIIVFHHFLLLFILT